MMMIIGRYEHDDNHFDYPQTTFTLSPFLEKMSRVAGTRRRQGKRIIMLVENVFNLNGCYM